MTDTARLSIRISSLEAKLADERLDQMAKSGKKAERATDGLSSSMKVLGAALLTAGAGAAGLKLVNVTREFELLNAQLVTATGSSEDAAIAFEAIQDFATQTPFDLQQVTTAFVKLTNLGLTPSEAALVSYGNTASAMGKSLDDFIEAVADAATGEFERLKEFGIRASSQGDQVAFTFRGVTTTVRKNAAEIEGYLQGLGDNQFGGAMANQMATANGAISNFGDEWDKIFLNISQRGLDDAMNTGVRSAISVLEELNAQVASGELETRIDAIGIKFQGLGQDVATTADFILDIWDQVMGTAGGQGVAGATDETIDFIIDAFARLPENVRAIIQLIGIEIASIVDFASEYGSAFGDVLGTELAKVAEKSKVYGRAIADAVNPFSDDEIDVEAEFRRLDALATELSDDAFARAARNVEASRQARRESIEAVLEERDATLKAFDEQGRAADELRKKYDDELAARRANTEDRLAGFFSGSRDEGGETASELKAREKRFAKLQEDLLTEEEAISDSYNRRLQIILNNTEEGSQKQAELKKRLDEQFADEAVGDLAAPDTFDEQLAAINDYYARRRELILSNTQITEEARTELEEELTRQRNEKLQILENARLSNIAMQNAATFGTLAELAKEFTGEQSKEYKALFAVSKAFSIVQATMKTYEAATGAYASLAPIPYVGPALGAAAAAAAIGAGLANVASIRGSNFAGAFDNGGNIPSGQVGLVGEFGPELVSGPANVTSREDTMALFNQAANRPMGMDKPTIVNKVKITNVVSEDLVAEAMTGEQGEVNIMNIIKRNSQTIKQWVS